MSRISLTVSIVLLALATGCCPDIKFGRIVGPIDIRFDDGFDALFGKVGASFQTAHECSFRNELDLLCFAGTRDEYRADYVVDESLTGRECRYCIRAFVMNVGDYPESTVAGLSGCCGGSEDGPSATVFPAFPEMRCPLNRISDEELSLVFYLQPCDFPAADAIRFTLLARDLQADPRVVEVWCSDVEVVDAGAIPCSDEDRRK